MHPMPVSLDWEAILAALQEQIDELTTVAETLRAQVDRQDRLLAHLLRGSTTTHRQSEPRHGHP
jgi:hypothetical protein